MTGTTCPLRSRGLSNPTGNSLGIERRIGQRVAGQFDGTFGAGEARAGLVGRRARLVHLGIGGPAFAPQFLGAVLGRDRLGEHALGGAVLGLGLLAFVLFGLDQKVPVPDVTGQTVTEAKTRLRAAGFDDIDVVLETSPTIPKDRVTRTDPDKSTCSCSGMRGCRRCCDFFLNLIFNHRCLQISRSLRATGPSTHTAKSSHGTCPSTESYFSLILIPPTSAI